MKNAPGYAPLPARFASIKEGMKPGALEAARTQGSQRNGFMNRPIFLRQPPRGGAVLRASQPPNAKERPKNPAKADHQHQDHTQHGQTKPAAPTPNNQAQSQATNGSGFLP